MRPFALITFPLILAALACPALGLANPYGVLTARAVAKPEQIEPGEKTQLTVQVYDGFKKPISTANIKISIKTGYFEASNQNAIFTDNLTQIAYVAYRIRDIGCNFVLNI